MFMREIRKFTLFRIFLLAMRKNSAMFSSSPAGTAKTNQIKTMKTTEAIPHFFSTVSLPSVAKWAADKVQTNIYDITEFQGRFIEIRTFIFEGKFPRFAKGFSGQWDSPAEGKQYTCRVSNYGGEYRGQKPTVMVSYTEYSALDGQPLPTA